MLYTIWYVKSAKKGLHQSSVTFLICHCLNVKFAHNGKKEKLYHFQKQNKGREKKRAAATSSCKMVTIARSVDTLPEKFVAPLKI